jgi:hypothetical protein
MICCAEIALVLGSRQRPASRIEKRKRISPAVRSGKPHIDLPVPRKLKTKTRSRMPQHVRVDLHVKASRASRTFHHGREAAF